MRTCRSLCSMRSLFCAVCDCWQGPRSIPEIESADEPEAILASPDAISEALAHAVPSYEHMPSSTTLSGPNGTNANDCIVEATMTPSTSAGRPLSATSKPPSLSPWGLLRSMFLPAEAITSDAQSSAAVAMEESVAGGAEPDETTDVRLLLSTLQRENLETLSLVREREGVWDYDNKEKEAMLFTIAETTRAVLSSAVRIFDVQDAADARPGVKGNGYRSLLTVLVSCVAKLRNRIGRIRAEQNVMFRIQNRNLASLSEYTSIYVALSQLLGFAEQIANKAADGELICSWTDGDWRADVKKVDASVFYSKHFGFAYASRLRALLCLIISSMASASDAYDPNASKLAMLFAIPTATLSNRISGERRSHALTKLWQGADIDFYK